MSLKGLIAMIKRCISIVLAAVIIMALSNPVIARRDGVGVKQFQDLPAIQLKDVKLRGTAISGIFKPIAIIEHTNTNQNRWYEVGDTLCGGRIVEIERGAIVLEMNGGRYIFGLPKGEVEGAGTILPEIEKIALGEKVSDNVWRVKLDAAIDMLTKLGEVMKEARIRPYFAIGKAAGVRIDRIKDGSIIKDMGLKDGDIIKGINGFGLMSPARIFEAYRKYKNDQLIQVQILRDERPVTLTYNIIR